MKAVISQPRYLPAINYFQRLYFADIFVFLDNVQRQSRGWENRNKILLQGKERWITIPIASSSREIIKNAKVAQLDWLVGHKRIIKNAYAKHPYYDELIIDNYYAGVENILASTDCNFADVLIHMVVNACRIMDFKPNIMRSSSIGSTNTIDGPEKLLSICKGICASIYISGANGRDYGIIGAFAGSRIQVLFHEFDYPRYRQHGQTPFVPWLSFFDVIFNVGLEETKKIITQEPNLKRV